MKMEELVSIIVPVYNIEDYLPRCLECIAAQSYKCLEIILVDDGSTDSSGLICDAFAEEDPRVKVIHQENKGLWAARNAGQSIATGEYFFFPDGDDYFHHDFIRVLYDAINLDSRCDLAIARGKKTWDIDGNVAATVIPKMIWQTMDDLIEGLLAKGHDSFYVYMWNKLYRRRLVWDIRSHDYSRSQDYDYNLRVFLRTNCAILVDNGIYYWLQRPGSLTKAPNSIINMLSCRTRIIYENYNNLSEENKRYSPLMLSRLYKNMVLWQGRSVNSASSKDVIRECCEYKRHTRKSYLLESGINIFEKMECMILLHFPSMTHFLMRITHNL
jgi:glycosyltransferase involved in cell wall biosynthesis